MEDLGIGLIKDLQFTLILDKHGFTFTFSSCLDKSPNPPKSLGL
jgi:hypothetical protein